MKRLFCLMVLLVAGPAHADQQAVELIAKVKPALVGIATHDPLRQPATELLGTGFAVADGRHLLTALHVVANRRPTVRQDDSAADHDGSDMTTNRQPTGLVVLVGSGEDGEMRDVTVVGRDPVNDLALLKIDGEPLPVLPLDRRTRAPDGSDIVLSGFPIGAVYGLYPASHRGMIAALTPISRPTTNVRRLTPEAIRMLRSKPMVYQMDATTLPGNSGGPVLDLATGTVIGIVNSSYVQEQRDGPASEVSGIGFAIPVAAAIVLLNEARLTP
ncbi:MAG: S1C family serine protease [Alphaproteobacteria bacterium]